MAQVLRIGEIGYANMTPIFQTLRSMISPGPFRFVRGTPARLNTLLAEGKIDLGPVSSIEYARNPKSYWVLPQLSISAIGSVESILLFSRRPLGDLRGAAICCTSASATSHALLMVLFNRFYRLGVECISAGGSLSEMLRTHPAALLIGDEALKAARRERRGIFVYDLGRLWHDYTGIPFVFALWLVRRDLDPGRLSMVRDLWSDLVLAKETAYRSFERLAASAPERTWMGKEGLVRYWRTISYDLTPDHLAGLSRFYREARSAGLVPGVPAPAFLPGTGR
ncbi:MAG: hypothetical protein A2V83_11025 [Nitrospirae bacterium RBG_16_64_22]|nr:MAG: hypothetical protein A2V83_11025 [Nitrospirae bacterium RBG_16_64_22]